MGPAVQCTKASPIDVCLMGPAVQYAVAMQSYRRLIVLWGQAVQYTVASPDFVCLMDGGISVYCGQSCRRLIALCGSAVRYTVASPVVVSTGAGGAMLTCSIARCVCGSSSVHRCLPAYLCVISARPYPLFIAPVHGPAQQLASCSPERYSGENLQPA